MTTKVALWQKRKVLTMSRIALCDASGPLTDLLQKLSGDNGDAWLQTFNRMLRTGAFQTLKTIKLGTELKTADDFCNAIKCAIMKIGNWGNDILGKPVFTTSNTEMELDLVNISVAELGFKDGATRKEIYERAIQFGLELCPAEVGPQLRLQYKDQPKGERLIIAMEPIAVSDGHLYVFNVEHGYDGLWLLGHSGHPDTFWLGGNRFVFVRRK